MRRFVLVRATHSAPGCNDWTCSGIKKLKRGVDLAEFITEYMAQIESMPEERFVRGETQVIIRRSGDMIVQWAFTEYKEEDIIHAVSHLSREELLRDLKELLPLKEFIR